MAGIYIHVPFCHKRCHYCDFYSSVNLSLQNDFVKCILLELDQKTSFFHEFSPKDQIIRTIYFGGGTPSLLSIQDLKTILEKISKNFSIAHEPEITIEVNPDDLNQEYLFSLKNIGFNRLSMGIQSFEDDLLKLMNRRHNAQQAEESIFFAKKAGFENISIDLIYALPGLANEIWQKTLEKAFSLPVQHISAYHLGIEEKTVFHHWLKKGKIEELNEEQSCQQFDLLHKISAVYGFEHYEISNLSKPGFRSQHNTSYWNNVPYLGLGPSAHSFNGMQRFWNIADISKYTKALENNSSYLESETLTIENHLHECIMTRLRTCEGINLVEFERQFGENASKKLISAACFFIENEQAEIKNHFLFLTLKGWFVSDAIVLQLIKELDPLF